jgi:hypothetical protein
MPLKVFPDCPELSDERGGVREFSVLRNWVYICSCTHVFTIKFAKGMS